MFTEEFIEGLSNDPIEAGSQVANHFFEKIDFSEDFRLTKLNQQM